MRRKVLSEGKYYEKKIIMEHPMNYKLKKKSKGNYSEKQSVRVIYWQGKVMRRKVYLKVFFLINLIVSVKHSTCRT